MEIIRVRIGQNYKVAGIEIDKTRPVEFVAERIGEWKELTALGSGRSATLYRASDGRLVVYVEDWSSDGTWFSLEPVEPGDLDVNGRHELLARACGLLTRPLTLDEALLKPI